MHIAWITSLLRNGAQKYKQEFLEMDVLTSRTGKRNQSASICKASDQNFDCGATQFCVWNRFVPTQVEYSGHGLAPQARPTGLVPSPSPPAFRESTDLLMRKKLRVYPKFRF